MTIEEKKLIFSHVTSVFKVWYKEKPFFGVEPWKLEDMKMQIKTGLLGGK